jgi:hypothetical protein
LPLLRVAQARVAKSIRMAYNMSPNIERQRYLRLRTIERTQFMTRSEFNHLLASVNALSPEQTRKLRQQLDRQIARPTNPLAQKPVESATRATHATAKRKPLTADEFNQQLFGAGRIASLPDPALDIDDDDPDDAPVRIRGEPLSETILRERR